MPKSTQSFQTEPYNLLGFYNDDKLVGSLDRTSGSCSLALSSKPLFPFWKNVSNKFIADRQYKCGGTGHMTPTSQLFHS